MADTKVYTGKVAAPTGAPDGTSDEVEYLVATTSKDEVARLLHVPGRAARQATQAGPRLAQVALAQPGQVFYRSTKRGSAWRRAGRAPGKGYPVGLYDQGSVE